MHAPLLLEKEQSQNYDASINSNGLLTLSGLLNLKFLLHMTTSFIKENHFNPSFTKSFGTQPFTKGGGRRADPSAISKTVAPIDLKFGRVLERPLQVLEMLKLFT